MARAQGLCCITSALRGKPSGGDARRSSAACICCIGPRHRPFAGPGNCVPCLAPNADHSVRAPLTSCCGTVTGTGDVRGRTPRTPKTPCTPTARRICGVRVRSRTPRRGQVCCFPAPASAGATAAAAATARTPRTPTTTTPIGRCCVRGGGGGATPSNAKLGRRSRWFRSARQALAQTPRRTAGAGGAASAVKVYNASLPEGAEEATNAEGVEAACSNDEYALLCREGFPREDVAAVTIQAYFRGHLARRAFRALRSLVRVQAVARGAYVRRQAETAVHCMQAMVRLQMRVRARQMPKQEGQLSHSS